MIGALENFATLEFRSKHPAVYVVGFKSTDTFTPFYVGETGNLTCRCADYVRAQFKAPTDFRVGTAIKCLEARGYAVLLKFRSSSEDKEERLREEEILAKELEGDGYSLLNRQTSFSYQTADKAEEARKVAEFVESLVTARGT